MTNNAQQNPLRLVREEECAWLTGLSRQQRWNLIREGRFPRAVPIGERAKAWRYGEIEAWMRNPTAWVSESAAA